MINVGFVGVGDMGRAQCKTFESVAGCRVAAGSDVSAKSRKTFEAMFPAAAVYSDHKKLLADTSIDAVVIGAPTLFHKDIAIAAMQSGRPVMTEKPMARTVADCRRMIDVSKKTRQLLMVAHCRRFDPDWLTFAKIFNSGRLGKPVVWRQTAGHEFQLSPWFLDAKIGGGPMIDGAVHNYDFANYLFGKPGSVQASSIKLRDCTAVDTATAIIRYASGNQLTMSWSWATGMSSAHDVLGPKGSMAFGAAGVEPPKSDGQRYGYYTVVNRKTGKPSLVKFRRDQADMYQRQAKHFLDCITGKVKKNSSPTVLGSSDMILCTTISFSLDQVKTPLILIVQRIFPQR